jgi:hypothetical protein
MRRFMVCSIVLLAFAAIPFSSAHGSRRPSSRHHDFRPGRTLIAFDTMYGVDGPFLGDAFAIRGVEGDEAPWEIDEVRGNLDAEGHLTILVKGLVFKDDPSVPPELRGKNDEAEFRGLVSCETEDGDQVVTRNVVTRGFHATTTGNSVIRATVDLPNPCVAPIVMVLAGSEDKWFAVTGFESEE